MRPAPFLTIIEMLTKNIPFSPDQSLDQRIRAIKAERIILRHQGYLISSVKLHKSGAVAIDYPSSNKDVELAEQATIQYN